MIEARLQSKLAAFEQALELDDSKTFEKIYPDSRITPQGIEKAAWASLREEAQSPLQFLKTGGLERYAPLSNNQLKLILVVESAHEVDDLVVALKEIGFLPRGRDQARHLLRRSLGMVVVSIPPVESLVRALSQINTVKHIGDGDATLQIPQKAPSGMQPFEMGAMTAMIRTMKIDFDAYHQYLVDTPTPVKISIIDTGIDDSNPALQGRVIARRDFSISQLGSVDPYGHGTHVAGIVVGHDSTAAQFSGISPVSEPV